MDVINNILNYFKPEIKPKLYIIIDIDAAIFYQDDKFIDYVDLKFPKKENKTYISKLS